MTTPASMPAGWYDDPFTDHLQRYWSGDSWTKETRPRPDATQPPPAYPTPATAAPAPGATGQPPVFDWLIPSILAIIFCAWPLAIPGLVFAIKANSAKKQGNAVLAAQQAKKARLWVLLSVALGIVVWVYLGYVIATTDIPADQGTLTPFGA